MVKEPITVEEISRWQRDYKQFQREWLDWLITNEAHYKSVEDAWLAYKTQRQGSLFIPG
jgi:hypothetical protein